MAKKRKSKLTIDFTGVEGGKFGVPDGEYLVEVAEVSHEVSDKSGKDYLRWIFAVVEGKNKGKKVSYITSLQPQALFNLRNLLEAMGVEVPNKAMNLDLDSLIGNMLGVEVENEKYQGKKRSQVVEIFSADELVADDEDDDEEDEEVVTEQFDEEDEEEDDEEDEEDGEDE